MLISTPQADKDIEEAVSFYSSRSETLGEQFVTAFDKVLEVLQDHPEAYQKVYADTRKAPIARFSYGVYYQHKGTVTLIVAVTHDSRHPNTWRSRK